MVPVIPSPVYVATPDAFVVAVAVSNNEPPAPTSATGICTPAWLTGLLPASRSRTAGCCANATPLAAVADGCVTIPSFVAGNVTLMPDDVVFVSPVDENVIVKLPAVDPPIPSPVNVATPDALVVA